MHDVGRPLPVIVNCVPTHPRRLMVPRYPDTRFKVNERRPPEPLTDEKKNQVFHNQSIRYPFPTDAIHYVPKTRYRLPSPSL